MPLMLIVVLGIFAMTRVTKSIGGKSATFFVRQQKSLAKAEGYIEETMNGRRSCRSSATTGRRGRF